MNVSLEINSGDVIKFYRFYTRQNGKIILNISEARDHSNPDNKKLIGDFLFSSFEYIERFIRISLEEVEEQFVGCAVCLTDCNNNIYASQYFSYMENRRIVSTIKDLVDLSSHTEPYNKMDLKKVCYSNIPNGEIIPEHLSKKY